eukprot:4930881-Pleurochrysis_carterae.AAC.2
MSASLPAATPKSSLVILPFEDELNPENAFERHTQKCVGQRSTWSARLPINHTSMSGTRPRALQLVLCSPAVLAMLACLVAALVPWLLVIFTAWAATTRSARDIPCTCRILYMLAYSVAMSGDISGFKMSTILLLKRSDKLRSTRIAVSRVSSTPLRLRWAIRVSVNN